ncbi:MAG TPA: hypothetical protein VH331_17670 [Allosphingosinicella sp.]|jgi:hypothetical protein|nr:hypothetical protein [Allosphingosinicella sp.]
MDGMKRVGSLLVRFILCFVLIACVWIVSIRYRIGPFDYRDGITFASNSGGFTDSDLLLLAASLGLLIGLLGLYRSGRISAVLLVLASLLTITAIDHAWSVYGYGDEYKGVPGYVFKPAIASVLIAPLAFLFPARREASDKVLTACWAALTLTIFLIGTNMIGAHVLHLEGMIGPTYMQNVFLCLLAAEAARQAPRLYRVRRIDDAPEPVD